MDIVLFQTETCHVFRLPPTNQLTSDQWEGNHLWTGTLKLFKPADPAATDGASCVIDLIDNESGQLFGRCPLPDDGSPDADKCVQSAVDSTRCFVLRIVKGTQHAYIGLNFPERSDAFKFTTAMTERHKRMKPAELLPERDLSMQKTEQIHVELSGKVRAPTQVSASSGLQQSSQPSQVSLSGPPPKAASGGGASRRVRTQ